MFEYGFVCFAFPIKNGYAKEEGEDMCKILKELDGLTPNLLLKKYEIELVPPINLKELVKKIGISSYPFDFSEAEKKAGFAKGDIIGAALSKGEKLTVLYADRLSDEDARETIAHEIAHCCLHAKDLKIDHLELKTDREDSELDHDKENDANKFAEELLVPQAALKNICGLLLRPTISVLADIFQVPIAVMKSRKESYPQFNILDDTESDVVEIHETGMAAGGV